MIRFAKIALVTLACFAVITASVGQSMVKKVKPKPVHHSTSKHHTPSHHSKSKHHSMVKHHSKTKHHTSSKHKPMMKKPMAKKPMMKPMHASASK